jgi:hypothetical protein
VARLHLVGERFLAGGQRIGVRHLENGGDAAKDGRARPGFEVFLVFQARLAEMHLAVDDARQDVQAGAIDRLAGIGRAERSDRGDAAVAHADIALSLPVVIDDGAVLQDQIESLAHAIQSLAARLHPGLRSRHPKASARSESGVMPVHFPKGRSVISVTGEEAEHFLQNLVTCDVAAIPADTARPCALLTPQGKVMFDFLVMPDGSGGYLIDIDTDPGGRFYCAD